MQPKYFNRYFYILSDGPTPVYFPLYVSVTHLGYIWVYLDPFSPKSVESGERVQTALEGQGNKHWKINLRC